MPVGSSPVPRQDRVGAESKHSAKNDFARNQGRQDHDSKSRKIQHVRAELMQNRGSIFRPEELHVVLNRFDKRDEQKHAVHKVDIHEQAGNQAQQEPLSHCPVWTSAIPIPEEQGHDKGGMGVRPKRVEIHVNGQRTARPDAQRGEQRPRGIQKFAGQQIGKQKSTIPVECRAERHQDPVGERKTVGGDVAAKANPLPEPLREPAGRMGSKELQARR